MRTMRWLILLLLAAPLCNVHAAEPQRFALVIGNALYARSPHLKNPANDAADVAAKLQGLGFTLIGGRAQLNVRRAEMLRLVKVLGDAAHKGDVALFYFAGHGLSFNGDNWLLPVDDGDIQVQQDVPQLSVSFRDVVGRMSARGGGTNIIILDACRDNPLPDKRGAGRGLAQLGDVPAGTFVLYAASTGQSALDGDGRNGLFTGTLLKLMDQPGLRLDDMSYQILAEVRRQSQGQQEPMVELKLTRPFVFRPASATAVVPPAPGTSLPQTSAAVAPSSPAAGAPPLTATLSGHRAGETFRDCEDGSCPAMVVIPPGQFRMGTTSFDPNHLDDSSPAHDVTIRYAFAVSKYPITRGEWRQYAEAVHPTRHYCYGFSQSQRKMVLGGDFSWEDPGFPQEDNHPVVCVTWQEARDYARWLTRRTHHAYRLLSEAEFEYVDRAGTTTTYFWGENADEQCRYANSGTPCGNGARYTSPVGHFQPNNFGLYDTAGNVYSWIEDCYHNAYTGAPTDGSAWTQFLCVDRVIRGGSWTSDTRELRAAYRRYVEDSFKAVGYVGFRIARTE